MAKVEGLQTTAPLEEDAPPDGEHVERAERRPAEPARSAFDYDREMARTTCCKCLERTTNVWVCPDCEVFSLCEGCACAIAVFTGFQRS